MADNMNTFVMKGIGEVGFMEKPVPEDPDPNGAIVRTTKALICTSDTHTVKGAIGERENLTLGHEGVGIVHKLGSEVSHVDEGDRVAVNAITPCFHCENCLRGYTSDDAHVRLRPHRRGLPEDAGQGRRDHQASHRLRVTLRSPGEGADARCGSTHSTTSSLTRRVLVRADFNVPLDAAIVSSFIHSKLDRSVLEQFERLEPVATRSTGVDHIDLEYCKENGIRVVNVPTYGANTVAEHVFALLLAISHHLVEAADRTRRGDFSQKGLQGFDLYGETMGVIGTGDTGRHTARIAKGFGMRVLANDIAPDAEAAREIGFEYRELEELLRDADVVSLHVPGTADSEPKNVVV